MHNDETEFESELIAEVQRGRRDSFRPIVEKYWPRVNALISKMTRDRMMVEDFAQESFLRAFEKIGQFDNTRKFGPWLMKITINIVVERMRTPASRLKLIPIDEAMFASSAPNPCDEATRHMLMDECIDRLPEAYKIIFALRHGLKFSYEEIAQILDEPLGTIKGSLYRSRELLKKILTAAPELSREGGTIEQ